MIDYISLPTLRQICADECAKCKEGRKYGEDDSLCYQCVLFDVMLGVKEVINNSTT